MQHAHMAATAVVCVGVLGVLGACASPAATTEWIGSAPCAPIDAQAARQRWLDARWTNTYYQFRLQEKDGDWTFDLSRVRHPSARWGEKPAARMAGSVTRISACTLELEGTYVESESSYQLGKAFRYHATLEGNVLSGKMFGAGQEWLEMSFRREEAGSR
ncbi:MAG: hypothetical protein ACT4NV_16930 [Rhodoferax sp.]